MSEEDLRRYGMREVGIARIVDDRFIIDLNDEPTVDHTECVYAFLAGDEIVRVGSSSGRLRGRMHDWQRDVSRALSGDFKRTRESEAISWREVMLRYGSARIFARKGTDATTSIGQFNLYLAEESVLIGRHKPRLCHDRSRHRDLVMKSLPVNAIESSGSS
ncbi:hypothetical protein [Hansschlegelia zhihuaiae]|uniref:Uncharacterized protein n=1 Tax=Hansschlegelia zhihuaiae TaxID=405005 RepID=A0A4Q0MM10_9HYPH|nr:hypothetical protein [Hansschlegelia zhihuaiae]RXF74791.1 hypothetical protein EK403_05295 [Hansschlegelia zhihuaiae]